MSRSAKDDAPSRRQYREMKRAAKDKVESTKHDTDEFRLECSFVLRLMGELGLRAGEVCHISESWIDFDRLEITIPEHDQCNYGRDGGPCGYCKKQARLAAENSEDSYEKALRRRWEPKNPSAERVIWYGWNDQLVDLIDEFMIQNEEYGSSRVSVNRRVKTIAKECEMISEEKVYPHALRAHAATSLAKKGMRAYQLKEFMGWAEVDGAMPYIKMASGDVRHELKRIHQNGGTIR